ncbi:uncharacterized protein LOC120654332 isoform X2 [Panicum virgatum]|uniref:RING-CH-type domain-containing protein n=1 Tax=Panicum virgatum TaxID=38727 RepID=A0A8T0WE53_PANVG|nr:uncharacterized protein LOC120654332 isoform X2 [Panicum virgatum]KAG2647851.1 hypothetical protein PVAP13_1NG006300 [Panicum virgatum]KAG2647853.1 hypothetical protein PVAP13_1NG006300 [Panicum virgatum]
MEDAELPIQHGGTLSAEDQKKPLSVTSCLLPACSLRSTAAVAPAAHAESQAAGDLCIRSLSFSKLLSFRMARAPSSLSTSEYIDQIDPETPGNSSTTKEEEEKLKQICRSQSVPTSGRLFKVAKGLRRVADSSSLGPAPAGVFRLRLVPLVPQTEASATAAAGEEEASAEDIAAEEAVCRICMVALSEEAVLKLECCCKGELALAHRGCAIKWFSIKGNGTCDVCSQEVLNLPVTLRRLHHHPSIQAQHQADPTTTATSSRRYRVWHGTPILVIISMLAYFCFLEQLLVGDHGTAALAISLPFACALGLFSSLTTTKMVSRRYVWIYSAVQFLFIVLFTHLFYRYVRMQAVIAIILSTFAGFSMAICTNSVLLQILRWRARHVASPTTTTTGEGGHSSREPPSADLEIALPPS